jgi:hypothetical protein
MVQRWRGEETDKQARRIVAHQGVFGHSRSSHFLTRAGQEKKREKKGRSPLSQVESGRLDEVLVDEVFLGSERQWLGVGNSRDYVLEDVTREKSGGLEDQVVRELYERGYTLRGKIIPGIHFGCDAHLHDNDRGRQAQQGLVCLSRRRRRAGSRSWR